MLRLLPGSDLIDSFILEKISETKIPGLSISIIKDNEVVYARGYGYRDLTKLDAMKAETLMGIGSVTKSFTALAILKLVEEGRLDLYDPVDKYVPIKIKPRNLPMTIHHLLTHSSGIPALGYAEAFIRSVLGLDHYWLPISNPEDIIPFMNKADKWIEAQPGEKFFYLNEGYVLLGQVISEVTGLRYEEFVKESILKPLGMKRSYFYREEIERDGNWATPYVIDRDGKHVATPFPFGITADGGLISNVLDLARYINMYLNWGETYGVKIIDRSLLEKMLTPYIKTPYQRYGEEAYGYGWSIVPDFHGYKLVNHSGSVLVHTAYVGFIPDKKIGVAILANASGYPLSLIGHYVLTYLLGKDPEELDFVKRDRILSKLVGEYATYKGTVKISVRRNGDFLIIEEKDRLTEITLPLVPVELSEDRALFYTLIRGVKYDVEFRISDKEVELIYERYKLRKR